MNPPINPMRLVAGYALLVLASPLAVGYTVGRGIRRAYRHRARAILFAFATAPVTSRP